MSQFGVWAYNVRGFDPSRPNRHVYGAILAAFALVLGYYVRQQRARTR